MWKGRGRVGRRVEGYEIREGQEEVGPESRMVNRKEVQKKKGHEEGISRVKRVKRQER